MNEIGDDNLMGYLNLSILLGEVVNFVEDMLSAYSFNDSIAIDISSLVVKMRAIEVKLNWKFIFFFIFSSAAIIVFGKEN